MVTRGHNTCRVGAFISLVGQCRLTKTAGFPFSSIQQESSYQLVRLVPVFPGVERASECKMRRKYMPLQDSRASRTLALFLLKEERLGGDELIQTNLAIANTHR